MTAVIPRLLGVVASCSALAFGVTVFSATTESSIGWRTDGTGRYSGVTPPTAWADDQNIAWKVKLPGRSQGSPIIVGQRVFVVSDPAELVCLNAADGAILWQRTHGLEELYQADKAERIAADYKRLRDERQAVERELEQAKGDADKQPEIKSRLDAVNQRRQKLMQEFPSPPSYANGEATNSAPTPISDGKHIYAVFGNGTIGAYTVAGERLWLKFIETPTIGFGHCSSPALADGKLVVHFNDLFALDAATGDIVWKIALSARHASPIVAEVEGQSVVVSPSGAVVRLSNGQVLIRDNRLSASECSPILHAGVLYCENDGSATALRLVPAEQNAVKLEKLWGQKTVGGRRTPSPVLHDGLLYGVNTDGILDVLDASTGESVYKQRLNIGSVYSSATVAGDYLYVSGTSGTTIVLATGREFREIARNKLEGFGSCPVFSERRMYVRTRSYLYCVGQ